MLAFAGNSLLCRLALAEGTIGAGSFTLIRLLSGAATLTILIKAKDPGTSLFSMGRIKTDILGAVMLLGYAAAFSFSYVNISTGTGALILFASVQFSMIGFHLFAGSRMTLWEWAGVAISLTGFGYLLIPTATRPDLFAALIMMLAGVCWATFTILGKQPQQRPAIVTLSVSFLLTSLFSLPLVPFVLGAEIISGRGIILAVLSGALTSGIGYAVWYAVLPALTVLKASVVQLTVPALASIAGWIILSEPITVSTGVSTLLILGGIALVFTRRQS
jgi:drug/metabolite transporter (DMT)-like permease